MKPGPLPPPQQQSTRLPTKPKMTFVPAPDSLTRVNYWMTFEALQHLKKRRLDDDLHPNIDPLSAPSHIAPHLRELTHFGNVWVWGMRTVPPQDDWEIVEAQIRTFFTLTALQRKRLMRYLKTMHDERGVHPIRLLHLAFSGLSLLGQFLKVEGWVIAKRREFGRLRKAYLSHLAKCGMEMSLEKRAEGMQHTEVIPSWPSRFYSKEHREAAARDKARFETICKDIERAYAQLEKQIAHLRKFWGVGKLRPGNQGHRGTKHWNKMIVRLIDYLNQFKPGHDPQERKRIYEWTYTEAVRLLGLCYPEKVWTLAQVRDRYYRSKTV